MNTPRVIWIISEGSPGHVSQSLGLVHALGSLLPVESLVFESRPRVGGLGRSLLRIFQMGKQGRALPQGMLHGRIGLEPIPADAPPPDLILSSGGKSVFAARSLAVRYRVPYVLIGERKPYPPQWFHTVLTPSSHETADCDVRMDLIPTKITPAAVEEAAAAWGEKPEGRLWAMLIGGRSRSHHFEARDWQDLAQGMVRVARQEGIRWLVTSSRRTGKETEALLETLLSDEVVADAVWWCRKPEKKLAAYLGAAEAVWATQDSVSMITEAVVSTRPVVVVSPRLTPFPESSYMPDYLANLESRGLILRAAIKDMADAATRIPSARHFVDPTVELAKTLCQRLGWEHG
jgi:uncharacterized protein